MRRVVRIVPMLVVFLFLPSCVQWQTTAQITPSSYQESFETVPRTVGKLRRLVMVSVIQPAPAVCTVGVVERSRDKIAEAYRILSEKKGYEVIPIENPAYQTKAQLPVDRLAEYSAQLADWTRKSDADAIPPDPIRHIIDAIGLPVGADGVVVLHILQTCPAAEPPPPTLRVLSAILSLGASEIPNRNAVQQIVVNICEMRSGRIVWKNTLERAQSIRFWKPTKTATDIELLFDSLDNAVPRVLTR